MISGTLFDDVTSNLSVFLITHRCIHELKNQGVLVYGGHLYVIRSWDSDHDISAWPTFFLSFVELFQRLVQGLLFEGLPSLQESFVFSNSPRFYDVLNLYH